MKRLRSYLTALTVAAVLFLAPATAFADPYWQADISTPASQNSRTFGVEYTVLSTEVGSFTLNLYQDGSEGVQQSQNTSDDPDAYNGNSGTFYITVPSDGDYSYYIVAIRDANPEDTKTTATKNVHVDATAPGAPDYGGKVRSGNSYSLTFTAPSDSDVVRVEVYASTSTSYQAGSATRVGSVTTSASQTSSFNYTAPDGATRYFALRAFDSSGNGSAIVGDPGITVTPVQVVTTNAAAQGGAGGAAGAVGTDGNVLAANTTNNAANGAAANNGTVDANGGNATSKPTTGANGKVLGTEINKNDSTNNIGWYVGSLLLAVLLAYYLFAYRRRHIRP